MSGIFDSKVVSPSGSGGGGGGTGTVTSVGLSAPGFLFAIAGTPVTTAGTLAVTLKTQVKNLAFVGPATGADAAPTFRLLVGADLPNPSSSSLGGVQSAAAVSNQWINSISTSGVPALSQPAFTNISGSVAASQLPNPSASTLGGIESYVAVSNQWINAISTSGVPSSTQPAFSNLSGTASLTAQVTGTLPIANGGTAVTSVTTAPTASSFAAWDANSNLSANAFIGGYATTATAAATTTLLVSSKQVQYFTGVTTQTVLMPVTSTLVLGQQYLIVNRSSGVVTVQSSGANAIQAMAANTQLLLTVILTSGTTAASWDAIYASNALGSSGANTALSNLSAVAINAQLDFDTDNSYKVGTKTHRASQMFGVKFTTGDDTTTTSFVTLANDADGSGSPGLIFGTSSTTSTWSRLFQDTSKTLRMSFAGSTILTFNTSGISSSTGGQWGAFNGLYNYLNLNGAFSWNDVYSHVNTSTATISDGRCVAFITGAGDVTTLTVNMPATANALPNMPLTIIFQNAVTNTLTWGVGTFAITPPTTVVAGQVCRYIFRGADSKWWPY